MVALAKGKQWVQYKHIQQCEKCAQFLPNTVSNINANVYMYQKTLKR